MTCRKPSAILWSIATTGFSTGMAAISNALFTLVEPGNCVVSIKDTYGGTSKVFLEMLPEAGVEVALCETEGAAGGGPRTSSSRPLRGAKPG